MTMPMDFSPLWISLATTLSATVATFFLGLLAAWKLHGVRSSSRVWLDGILTLPLVLPPTVVGFFLLLVLGRKSPIGRMLESLDLMIIFSWPATVIAATVVAFPLMYRTTQAAFEQVNPTLLHAARTLGASETRIFFRILLPLAAPGIVAGTVLAFARAMGEFGATLMLAGNIPGRTQTMPIAVFSAVEGGNLEEAYLWVAIMVILSLAMMRLLNLPLRFKSAGATADAQQTDEAISLTSLPTTAEQTMENADGLLELDLSRQLSSFTLRLKFSAGNGAVGLLGPSGAGKSMTLRMIAGIEKPDKGRIVLNGRTLCDLPGGIWVPPAKRRVGVVFQDYALFPHLTVEENVAFGIRSLNKEQRKARVAELLAQLHISEIAHQRPGYISGGQKQRVAIARCLATNPDALLFDEPFAALDPHLRRRMEEQLRIALRKFRGGVLFVTHDMEEAFRFCKELLILDQGRILLSGPKHHIFEQPETAIAARLTGCKNIVTAERCGPDRLFVRDWGCTLTTLHAIPEDLVQVGYRSHQFRFQQKATGENVFDCWLVEISEAPHEFTLYLHLHAAPAAGAGPHVQADISREQWLELKDQPQPWKLQFVPQRILPLQATIRPVD